MIEVLVKAGDINTILKLVHDVRDSGYIINVDYEFEFRPEKFDHYSGDVMYNKHTVFRFYNEQLASWFTLKWAEYL